MVALLAACGSQPETAEPIAGIPTLAPTAGQPTPTLVPTTGVDDQPTAPPPPTITANAATVVPTPTAPAPPTEVPAGTADLAPAMPAQALLSWILAQRAAGRSLDDVAAELLAAGILYDAAANQLYANGAVAYAAVDSAGSGVPFWALGLYRGESGNGRLYEFWLVGTDHLELSFAGTDFGEMPPLLLASADLSGDGLPDYLLQQSNCGAHTCFGTYWVYSHHGGVLRSRLNVSEGLAAAVAAADPRANIMPEWSDRLNMSSPTITIADVTGDGVADIQFRGGIIGSVGAGFHQGFDQLWSWSGTQMLMADFQWDYTGFRHHELYDGDFAARLGERDIAMSHYLRVMFDE
ncbi:MAG: hypothetical protein KDE59_23260, partial [Anaerolineales bacterium]|nr:hypothetical protein [Anaerolineales bacterium]